MSIEHVVQYRPRLASETITYSLDVSRVTPTPSNPVANVSVYSGAADPGAASIITVQPAVTGSVISWRCAGGVGGTTYRIAISYSTPSGDRLTNHCLTPVEP